MMESTKKIPLRSILALTSVAFLTIITELLPSGVMTSMKNDLLVSEAKIGLLVSFYAIGTTMTTLMGSEFSKKYSPKALLIFLMCCAVVLNTITALSQNYMLTILARVLAGACGGITWPLITAYAVKLAGKENSGKAISIVMGGSTLAFSGGLPAGAYIGEIVGWRWAFIFISLASLLIIFWIFFKLPNLRQENNNVKTSIFSALKKREIIGWILGIFTISSAIYFSYTYLSPLLISKGIINGMGKASLIFGLGAMAGITVTGLLIDTHLKKILPVSLLIMALTIFSLAIFDKGPLIVFLNIAFWGITFGGMPSLLQTSASLSAKSTELGSALTVMMWNLGLFTGSFTGGVVLSSHTPSTLVLITSFLLITVLPLIYMLGRRY